MTIRELLNKAEKKLPKSTSPNLDAEVLLSHVLDKPKTYLLANPNDQISPKTEKQFSTLVARRQSGWPVPYITNQKEFYGRKFFVDKNVLIPRPETEELVELAIKTLKNKKNLKILDIGTGSGNIIISLARNLESNTIARSEATKQSNPRSPRGLRPLAMVNLYFASDTSKAALKVAKKNAKLHKTSILFKQSDILKGWKDQSFDVIIANLPYLEKETDSSTKFEPKTALIAKKKGLALYEDLFTQVSTLSPQPSTLFLEIGHDQGKQIKKLAARLLPAFETKIYKDLSKFDRYAMLKSQT
ncbi:MAG: peptide chain release factor N(5)-glutamine methyltransferase [Candidatus Doudnabacteria bacterium]